MTINENIDDKAAEAAIEAYRRAKYEQQLTHKDALLAALAAADKVRAEGFDASGEAKAFCNQYGCAGQNDLAEQFRAAFAAGLAKGDAERAALRRLVLGVRDDILSGYERDAIASKIDSRLSGKGCEG